MKIYSNSPCIVIFTERKVELKINGIHIRSLLENHLSIIGCDNNIIELSPCNNSHIAHVSHTILDDYLRLINKDLLNLKPWPRMDTPVISSNCRLPDIFKQTVLYNDLGAIDSCSIEQSRFLLFTILSNFLEEPEFISLIFSLLRNRVKDCVCQIIQSDIGKEWNLKKVASALFLSPSLLKKN